MPELWGIVLAAGSSTRLGRPKQLVEVDGRSALKHSARQVAALTGEKTLVVLGFNHDRLRRELRDIRCLTVLNPEWKAGMASSLQIAIHALPDDADGALITTCDQLQVSIADLESLIDEWRTHPDDCVAAAYANTIGVPAIVPRSQFPRFDSLSGDRGAKSLLADRSDVALHTIDMPHAAFDLDTPADLEAFTAKH